MWSSAEMTVYRRSARSGSGRKVTVRLAPVFARVNARSDWRSSMLRMGLGFPRVFATAPGVRRRIVALPLRCGLASATDDRAGNEDERAERARAAHRCRGRAHPARRANARNASTLTTSAAIATPRGPAARGAGQPHRDPTRGAERRHEVPEHRQPRARQARQITPERDERVDEVVPPQPAPRPAAYPVREGRDEERRTSRDAQHFGEHASSTTAPRHGAGAIVDGVRRDRRLGRASGSESIPSSELDPNRRSSRSPPTTTCTRSNRPRCCVAGLAP